MSRLMVAFGLFCVSLALRSREVGGDAAAELAGAIAGIARKVALDDGYGGEFAAAFSSGSVEKSGANAAVAFVDLQSGGADRSLILQQSEATGDDIVRSISALAEAGAAERAHAKVSFAADWQRMLAAESRATDRILRAELAPLSTACGASFLGMDDLTSIAGDAVSAADAYMTAAKQAQTSAQVAGDMAKQDVDMLVSLQGALGLEDQQRETYALRGAEGLSFLQASKALDSNAVANIRLVEPGSRVSKAATAARHALSDALGALEARQQSDEALFAGLLSSSGAVSRQMQAVES